MNKKLLSIVFIVVLVQCASAQQIRFGVFANPGVSWMKSDVSRISGNGTHYGINAGLTIDNFFAPHYAFSTGISIHTIGGVLNYKEGKILRTSDGDKTLTPGDVTYNLQYLHVPLGLKLRSTEIGYSTYFVDLGVDPMVNVKSTANVKAISLSKAGVGKEINLFYMAYHISAGLEYKIVGNTAAVVGITYMNGFTDVTDNYDTATEKTVMHCFEVHLGLMF